MPREDWLIVGIAGATCSGKSTVARELRSLFANGALVHQDDYFHDASSEKHARIPELNHVNFEILFSIDMESMKNRIKSLLETEAESEASAANELATRRDDLQRKMTQRLTATAASDIVPANECLLRKVERVKRVPNVLILDGFLVLNDDELYDMCDLRFYFTIDRGICRERRKLRTYDPPDVPGYFEWYVWPYYLIHYEEVLKKASEIFFVDGCDSRDNNFKSVLHKLLNHLS